MTFDLTTVIVTTAALSAVLGGVQWLAWLHVRSEGSLAIWGSANLACAVGIGLLPFAAGPFAYVVASLANGCFMLAAGLAYYGMRSFDRVPASWPVLGLVTGIAVAMALASAALAQAPAIRMVLFSAGAAAWLGAAAWRLVRVPANAAALSRLAVALFLSVFCAMHLARLASVVAGMPTFIGTPLPEQLSATLLLCLVCGVGLNFGALFMVLDRLASCDELTGLTNRRALLRWGQAALNSAVAHKRPLSVLLVDLDHFKAVNDLFGHRIGDRALEMFAGTAKATLRPGDLIGRYGGEEFCVILPGADRSAAAAAAERLRARVAERLAVVDGHAAGVTAAIGVATWNGDDPLDTIDALIDAADHALYAAKDGGRNRVIVAPPRQALRRDEAAPAPAAQTSGSR